MLLAIIYDITLFLAITSILSYILLIFINLLFLSAISKEKYAGWKVSIFDMDSVLEVFCHQLLPTDFQGLAGGSCL